MELLILDAISDLCFALTLQNRHTCHNFHSAYKCLLIHIGQPGEIDMF